MKASDPNRPRPFPVDPGVLARIRPMTESDVVAVARLHRSAMGHSLWARLGEPFLCVLYTALLAHPSFIGYVYDDEKGVRGFIAGTEDAAGMMHQTFRRNAWRLARVALAGVWRDWSAAIPLVQTPVYFKKTAFEALRDVPAESLFCSFEPDLRGKRISGLINKVLFDELAARGHRYVKITTEANNAGAVRQLSSWGFEQVGTFAFYRKTMIAWRLDLAKSDRVDPDACATR